MGASSATESFSPDKLLVSERVVTKSGTMLSGENNGRGTLLGRVLLGTVTTGFTGTGNGTITMDATTPLLANAQVGAYVAKLKSTATDGGTFAVFDPKGNYLGDVAVGATFANQIKFVIADGGTDFSGLLTTFFTITVAAGSGKYKKSLAAAVDGSQYPSHVLVEAVDATSEDKGCSVYVNAEVNEDALTYGTGHTADSVRDMLELRGLHLRKPVAF